MLEYFGGLTDPRVDLAKGHELLDIIVITICAVICGADYVRAVKENQGQLHDDVRDLFQGAEEFGFEGVPYDFTATLENGHRRIERRECWAISDPESLEYLSTGQEWPKLRSAVKVVGHRETAEGAEVQPRHYISSLEAPAQRLLQAVRRHWGIENSLHWTLDVAFREDQCRVRKDHTPRNMVLSRQISHLGEHSSGAPARRSKPVPGPRV